MPSLFKALGAVLCLVFALCFAAPNAHADSFIYTYTATALGGSYSWTTEAIPAVTGSTFLTTAELTATSVTALGVPCAITGAYLDFTGSGNQLTSFSSQCVSPFIQSADALPLADYSTPGSYTSVFNSPNSFVQTDTLVVSAVQTPEPSSLALMLAGVGLVFGMRKRWTSGLQLAS